MSTEINRKGNVMFPKVAIALLSAWLFLINGNLDPRVMSGMYLQGAMVLVLVGFLVLFLYDGHKLPLAMVFFPLLFLYMYLVSLFNGGGLQSVAKVVVFAVVVWMAVYCAEKIKVEVFLKVVVLSLFFLSVLNFFVIVAIPEIGVDVGFFEGDWKGVYDQKNSLGRLASILMISAFLLFLISKDFGVRLYSVLFSLAAMFFSYNTGSRTALATSLIVVVLIVAFRFLIFVYSRPIKDKVVFTLILFVEAALVLFFIAITVSVVDLHTSYDGVEVMGYFVSLTGRVTIWDFVLENLTGVQAILGYGLDNFWTYERFNVIGPMQGMGDFYPHDSHNGYVDLLVQGGWLSVLVYIAMMMLVAYYFVRGGLSLQEKLCVFGVFALFFVSNLTESYVTKSTNIVNFLFVYAVALCCLNSNRLMKSKVIDIGGWLAGRDYFLVRRRGNE